MRMRIKQITIKNYRSIENADIDVSAFTIFVGQNNCGKTNLFEAMEWFFNGTGKGTDITEMKFKHDSNLEISVSVLFENAQHGLSKMTNPKNQETIRKNIGENDLVEVRRKSSDDKKRYFIIDGEEKLTGTGFDAALNDFLPRFEYIHTKQYHDSVCKYAKGTPVAAMLSSVLSEILQENSQYREFENKFNELFQSDGSQVAVQFVNLGNQVKLYLEKQFPDCSTVKFEVTPPAIDDLLKRFETFVDDGVYTTAEEKGDGMQRALMLAIIQAYADFRRKKDDAGKSFLFFIDEAELHLHPTAQRKLKNVLLELSKRTDQVFINTHSSVLVADSEIGQKVIKVEKEEGKTFFEYVDEDELRYVIYDLLGGSPSDLLFPRNILIVEGRSEVALLKAIILRFYKTKPRIQIIPAQGDVAQTERTINSLEKVYNILQNEVYGNKLVIMADGANDKNANSIKEFLKKYPELKRSNRWFQISKPSLEEYYPIRNAWQQVPSGKTNKQFLAKNVAMGITQNEFEMEMVEVFKALSKCWENAYVAD